MTKINSAIAQMFHSPANPVDNELVLGTLTQYDVEEGPFVALKEDPGKQPVWAQTTVDIDEADVGRTVVLRFLRNKAQTPIIVGFLKAPRHRSEVPRPRQAELDGQSVVLTADRQMELRCGRASLVLHKDGLIELRGTEVVSRASHQQKIQGGNVQIN